MMAEDKTSEPESNFVRFVREMSEAAYRVEEFDEDPERVMSEAGLSDKEKEIVRKGDEEEILTELGQTPAHGTNLQIRHIRVRFRRRRPPTKPTTAD
jgi:hypothetical protein